MLPPGPGRLKQVIQICETHPQHAGWLFPFDRPEHLCYTAAIFRGLEGLA